MPLFSHRGARRADRIDVLTNKNAGLGKNCGVAAGTRIKLEEVFSSADSGVDVRTYETESLGQLDQVIAEMLTHPPMMVIIIGGDGTAQKTIDRLLKAFQAACKRLPMIMILSAGTVNAIRNAYELLGPDPERGRDAVFEKIRRGEPPDIIHRRVLKITLANGLVEHGFIMGLGLPVRFLERYYLYAPPRGLKRALRTMLWVCWNEIARVLPPWRRRSIAHPFAADYALWSDNRRLVRTRAAFSGIVMASVEQIGLGCRLTARALERPGHFHAVLSQLGIARTLLNAPKMFLGRRLFGPAVDEVVTRVELHLDEPMPLMIDGEMYPAEQVGRRLMIESGPLLDIVRS